MKDTEIVLTKLHIGNVMLNVAAITAVSTYKHTDLGYFYILTMVTMYL